MRCLISGLLVHGLARRSMDISATNWYQSFTYGLLARPEAAERDRGGTPTAQPLAIRPLFLLFFLFTSAFFVF